MASDPQSLRGVYDGWDGYQLAIVRSVAPRTIDELRWRAAPQLRSAGEIARHIAEGRVDWFSRTFGVEATVPAARVAEWRRKDAVEDDPAELVRGLEASWRMIEEGLARWTVADLAETFPLDLPGHALRAAAPVDPVAHPEPRSASRRRARLCAWRAGHRAAGAWRRGRPPDAAAAGRAVVAEAASEAHSDLTCATAPPPAIDVGAKLAYSLGRRNWLRDGASCCVADAR